METTVIFGRAFLDNHHIKTHEQVRVYEVGDNTYIGSESTDMEHFCSGQCAITRLNKLNYCRISGNQYFHLHVGWPERIDTADLQDLDTGDDPYVECAACGEVLVRDDVKYETTYGMKLSTVLDKRDPTKSPQPVNGVGSIYQSNPTRSFPWGALTMPMMTIGGSCKQRWC